MFMVEMPAYDSRVLNTFLFTSYNNILQQKRSRNNSSRNNRNNTYTNGCFG
jgi:hypothetical protein